jgi:tryptophan-rich sensory protein
MNKVIKFIVAVSLPLVLGAFAGYFTAGSVNGWYNTINKPSFNPPNWIFAPVWTTLYVMMGIAFYIVWIKVEQNKIKTKAIIFYFIQLILNFCWSVIFFYAAEPGWAFIEILLLWSMIAATIIKFAKISKPAAWLMAPYIVWVSFAAVLNFSIWWLNR